MNKRKGLVYVFSGEGKGKTSAALGVTVRALLSGMRVCWVSFIKSEDWDVSEKGLGTRFENLEMTWVGEGFYFEGVDDKRHKEAANRGMELVKERMLSGDYDLIVMDEVNNAVSEGLVELDDLVELVNSRKEVHFILTGRGVEEEIVRQADLVTECRSIKHPYDKGELAVKGLDY